MSLPADSAGRPWLGRSFPEQPAVVDDGAAPARLVQAIARFRAGGCGEAEVIDAIRDSRLLVPLVAELGESASGDYGMRVDKRAELAIVTVAGPDGRSVLPVFSSTNAMTAWNAGARPVPADGVRVAIAAAGEGTELVVLDPTSATEFGVRRPALWALAQSQHWIPSYLDPDVRAAFLEAAAGEESVSDVRLAAGDPTARLVGPELAVTIALAAGLDAGGVDAVLARMAAIWAESDIIRERVDSLRVAVVPAAAD